MKPHRGQGISIFIGLIVSLFGFFLVMSQTRQLTRYVPVEAVILTARVEERTDETSTYLPEIKFEYVVGGRTYLGRRVFPLTTSNSFRYLAEGWVKKFPPGRHVKAYYDPRKPAESFLVRKVGLLPYAMLLIGAGILLGGLGMGANSRLSLGVGRRSGVGVGTVWGVLAGLSVVHYLYMVIRY